MEYKKINGEVFRTEGHIDVSKKIAALQDDVTRLNAEIASVEAEIASLEALK